jgi:nitrate reductase NapE component
MIALAADAAPMTDLLDVFNAYNGNTLFTGLTEGAGGQPSVLGRIGWIFTGFGAVFVLWGFVLRTRDTGGEGKMGEIARTWIVIGFMVAGPFLMRASMEAADGVYSQAIGGPANLATACVRAAYAMPELTSLFDALRRNALAPAPGQAAQASQTEALINDANDGSVLGYLDAFMIAMKSSASDLVAGAGQTWSGMVRIATLASGFGSAMIKCLLIILTLGPVYLLLLVSAAIIWFMGQLRFFLAVSGTMMLPLFVGMFSLPAGHPSRQSAQAYVMNMVSLALWPVSWAIGHTGTIALYNALISLVAGTSRVPALADALQWAAITSVAPSQAQLQAGEAALGNWFMGNLSGLLSILVGGLGFCLWVLMVSILGPVFLHRVLTAGALFMTQAAASTGRQSAVAGKMAVDLARGPGLGAALGLPAGGARAGEALTGSSAREVVSTASNAWRHLAEGGGASMGGAARSVDVSDGKETGAG